MTNLLIVESPGKIKKLKKILGSDWDVKASVGHIRQLSNDGNDSLGFLMEGDRIQCKYAAKDKRAKSTIAGLKFAANKATQVFLASDPDREGETIAWHLADVLKLKNPQRVVYQEITESAVRRAIAAPRPLDTNLVAAGRCRDCLDKLVGYKGSPLVWRLNNGAKSVGRVQSAALHIVCQREREIQSFVSQNYWSIFVEYAEGFKAFYNGSNDGQDQDDEAIDDTGLKGKADESSKVLSQSEAERLVAIAQSYPHQVIDVQGKLTSKKPPAPFTTSALQQVAGSRIKFSPEQTMQVAQKLYEAGLITYMRTDSVHLSPEFCAVARTWLQEQDPDNVPDEVAKQKSKKDAQEAHEAIRPTDLSLTSADLNEKLSEDEFKLYFLIWMRAIASQCKPAKIRKTVMLIQSGDIEWKAKGQVIEFEGYAKYWKDLSKDNEPPSVEKEQTLTLKNAAHEAKKTKPPVRYTEPKLVQVMEKKGIGRPSTYAPTIKTLKTREYIGLKKGRLVPEIRGMEVDQFMIGALPELLQAEFTAQMEASLDAIASGNQDWERYLTAWNRDYFIPALSKALADLPDLPEQQALKQSDQCCPQCQKSLTEIPSRKVKHGFFLKCGHGCMQGDRALVLFWSDQDQDWQLPSKKESQSPGILTDVDCPACKGKLEIYRYQKGGEEKSMLRCADPVKRRNNRHKKAVFFMTEQGDWWSPGHGVLEIKAPIALVLD